MFKYNAVELKLLAIIKKKARKENPFACTKLDLIKLSGYGDTCIADALRVLEATERIEWDRTSRKKPVIKFIK